MGKNIVVRLHVYLMCFLLAFAPAYSYASAAPLLDFTGVVNAAKTGGGFVADYLFRRASNDPNYNAANDDRFETKGHAVSNNQMGDTWRKRWAGQTAGIGAGLAATAAIAALLAAADWVLDPANNTIRKYEQVVEPKYLYSLTTPFGKYCTGNSPAALMPCLAESASPYNMTAMPNSPVPAFYPPIESLLIGQASSASDYFVLNTPSGSVYRYVSVSVENIGVVAEDFIDATPEDIAAAVAQADLATLQELATSPNYKAEPHAPTVAAAAKAEPAGSDACPAGQTKVNGVCQAPPSENKCPAGQVFDTTTGKCKAATAAQCPVGQVYDVVQKKCVTPKLPDDEDDWPEFCEWAAPVCDFIEWAKQDTDKFDVSPVDVKDTAADAQSITSQILTLGYVSGGIKACPADYTFTFTVMGQGIDFDLSYKGLCDMLLMARPVVISIAYFQAAKIVFIGRRD